MVTRFFFFQFKYHQTLKFLLPYLYVIINFMFYSVPLFSALLLTLIRTFNVKNGFIAKVHRHQY